MFLSREVRVLACCVGASHAQYTLLAKSWHTREFLTMITCFVGESHVCYTGTWHLAGVSAYARNYRCRLGLQRRRQSTVNFNNPLITATCSVQQLKSAKVSDIIISSAYFCSPGDTLENLYHFDLTALKP